MKYSEPNNFTKCFEDSFPKVPIEAPINPIWFVQKVRLAISIDRQIVPQCWLRPDRGRIIQSSFYLKLEELLNCAHRTTDKAKKCRISELHKFNFFIHAQILQDIHSNTKPFNPGFSLVSFLLTSYMHQFGNYANIHIIHNMYMHINIHYCMYTLYILYVLGEA